MPIEDFSPHAGATGPDTQDQGTPGGHRPGGRPLGRVPPPLPQRQRPSADLRAAILAHRGEDPSQERRCWGCAAYAPSDQFGVQGECRRMPPAGRGSRGGAGFLKVDGWWWCLQFQKHDTETAAAG